MWFIRGLILLFLTAPLGWLSPAQERSTSRRAAQQQSSLAGEDATETPPTRSGSHRMSRGDARASGLGPRSEAHARWTASLAASASSAAAAAEADAQRAAEAAVNAAAAARRAREAAQRIEAARVAILSGASHGGQALSPGQIAAAATEAASASHYGRRARQAAEWSAACAVVAAGPGEEPTPDVVYGTAGAGLAHGDAVDSSEET